MRLALVIPLLSARWKSAGALSSKLGEGDTQIGLISEQE
jgi:hypothetical protein